MNYDAMNYDAMNVMSLLCAYAEWAMCGESDKRIGEEFVIIESALRKAVVREASVGTALFSVSSMPKLLWGVTGIKEGRFYLIPKETP